MLTQWFLGRRRIKARLAAITPRTSAQQFARLTSLPVRPGIEQMFPLRIL